MSEIMDKSQALTIDEVMTRLVKLHSPDRREAHKEAEMLLLDALVLADCERVVQAYHDTKKRIGFVYA